MRIRNKPWAEDYLAQHDNFVIKKPEHYKGQWRSLFQNDGPLNIEVGTGKGQFITRMGQRFPEQNFIGIERESSVIVSALEKLVSAPLDNVKLLNVNAVSLSDFFAKGEVDGIYLNFSDPWPKKRHEKRRLTYHTFLSDYEKILKPGGRMNLKTDNQGLFEYSLESFSKYGMVLENISLDLHHSEMKDNITTEYEEKFSGMGHRIYRCEARFTHQ